MLLWREDPRRGRLVVAACEQCQSLQIRVGMRLHEATDLLNKKVSGVFSWIDRHDPLADREALACIARQLQEQISPLVAIEPDPVFSGLSSTLPQTLLLNVTGIGDWFGDEPEMLRATHQLLEQSGLRAKTAVADSFAAAWALAHFHPSREVIIEQLDPLLTSLPARGLRLEEATAHQLDRLGLRRIADVLAMPRAGLASRLGQTLLDRIDELLGTRQPPLVMQPPAIEASAVCELEYPTEDRAILLHRLQGLVDQVARHLSSQQRGALRLTCRFEMTQHPPETMELGLFMPTADAAHLFRLMSQSLEQHRLPSMVQKLILSVGLAGPLQSYQPSMFADDSISQVTTRRLLARMIETVAGRLGRESVMGVRSTRDPLPEAAYKLQPLAGESRSTLALGGSLDQRRRGGGRKRQAGQSDTNPSDPSLKSPRQSNLAPAVGPAASDPLRRPLRLFKTPRAINVLACSDSGLPSRVEVDQRVYTIRQSWGPERIETGWWQGPQVRRDYYRVELDGGAWWWIYRELGRSGAAAIWKCHGQFS